MKRVLAVLLAITFLSLTASAAKKPYYHSKSVSKRASSKKGRSKKNSFGKSHNLKRKSAKPSKRAHR
jgi:hypothetical protein